MPKAPNWEVWKHIPRVTLIHGVALSLNVDPRETSEAPKYEFGTRYEFGVELSDKDTAEFDRRLYVATENVGPDLPLKPFKEPWGFGEITKVALSEFATWAHALGWRIPDELVAISKQLENAITAQHLHGELPDQQQALPIAGYPVTFNARSKAVASGVIVSAFVVIPDPKCNKKWWRTRLSDPGDYGLTDARAERGRGPKPSFWYPELIASWLMDKHHMKEEHVLRTLREYFRDCPVCVDAAERFRTVIR